MKGIATGVLAIGLVPLLGSAATLSLRSAADGSAEINMLVGETATIDIVLEFSEAESLLFINLFPQAVVTEGREDFLEVLDFGPAAGVLEDATRDTSFFPAGNPYPLGEGIPLDDYHLILGTTGVIGPAEIILEQVTIHANALGSIEFTFQEDILAPTVFDIFFNSYGIAPVGFDPIDTLLTLGSGDGREGGAGPLVINVVVEVPAEPVDLGSNDNENDNASDPNGSGSSGSNGTTISDPGPSPTGACGVGMVIPAIMTLFGLMCVRGRDRK